MDRKFVMEKVLVVFASRMGSTGEIAAEIGKQLTRRGFEVDVYPAREAPDAPGYGAVIVGSGVYLRRWHPDAVRYLKAQAPDLAERSTFLFQSGPCGPTSETSTSTPHTVATLCCHIGANPPTTFGGNLDPAKANSLLARLITHSDLAGDFRDWTQIHTYADTIADQLHTNPAMTGRTLTAV
jgi:menaquinone-dependent protoporphyrinogen oxidase